MADQPERDDKGRFARGNSGGPGRLPRLREDRYYEILMRAVTFEDWTAICKRAAEQALRGDAKAREWLSGYLVGPPEQDHNFDGEIKVIVEYIRAPNTTA